LFVITAVREVRHPEFDSATKDTLALLRFPAFYACGFVTVPAALAGTRVALIGRKKGQRRRIVVAAWLLAMTLALMVADYFAVYLPIVAMITPPGGAHSSEFAGYHRASIAVNTCDVVLCGVAAVLLCWREPPHDNPPGKPTKETEG
jgi:hypothetical protein